MHVTIRVDVHPLSPILPVLIASCMDISMYNHILVHNHTNKNVTRKFQVCCTIIIITIIITFIYQCLGTRIISSATWQDSFQLRNVYSNGQSFPSTTSGTSPNVIMQVTGNTNGCCNNDNYVYMNNPIHESRSFELSFSLKILEQGWSGEYFSVFFGYDSIEGHFNPINTHGYVLSFYLYCCDHDGRGLYLYDSNWGKLSQGALPSFDNSFKTVKVKYTQSTTNTWMIYYDNSLVLSFNDPANSAWVRSAGPYWGFHAATGGAVFKGYIKSVALMVLPDTHKSCTSLLDIAGRGIVEYTSPFTCDSNDYCCDSRCWQVNTNDCGNTNYCGCWSGYYVSYTPATCDAGYYMSSANICQSCPSGYSSLPGATTSNQCNICNIGYYMSSGFCQACSEGFTTLSSGATSVDQCGKFIFYNFITIIVILSIVKICTTEGGFGCCSMCSTYPCTMSFSSSVTYIGIHYSSKLYLINNLNSHNHNSCLCVLWMQFDNIDYYP